MSSPRRITVPIIALTLLILFFAWVACNESTSEDEPQTSATESTRAESASTQQQAEPRWHWKNMMLLGRRMIARGYDVTPQQLPSFIAAGVAHIDAPDRHLYEVEWRLSDSGWDTSDQVPVSFLNVTKDGPFTSELVTTAIDEFLQVSSGIIDEKHVRLACKQVQLRLADLKRTPPKIVSWVASSKMPEKPLKSTNSQGNYFVRAVIQEWDPESYSRQASEIFIYFVYIPPDREVDLGKVYLAGFSGWDD